MSNDYDRPNWAVENLEKQLNNIKNTHRKKSEEVLFASWQAGIKEELAALRAKFDGNDKTTIDFWFREGFRKLNAAREKEYQLAKMKGMLKHISYARVSKYLNPGMVHLYKIDTNYITNVFVMFSIEDCEEVRALLDEHRIQFRVDYQVP